MKKQKKYRKSFKRHVNKHNNNEKSYYFYSNFFGDNTIRISPRRITYICLYTYNIIYTHNKYNMKRQLNVQWLYTI